MKHVEVINKIIEAEQLAQQMAGEARDKQLHLEEDLQESAQSMRKNYQAEAQKRIDVVREREDMQTREKIDALTVVHKLEMDNMEQLYQKNRDAWATELFNRIIAE